MAQGSSANWRDSFIVYPPGEIYRYGGEKEIYVRFRLDSDPGCIFVSMGLWPLRKFCLEKTGDFHPSAPRWLGRRRFLSVTARRPSHMRILQCRDGAEDAIFRGCCAHGS
jgi:hypothetical protein